MTHDKKTSCAESIITLDENDWNRIVDFSMETVQDQCNYNRFSYSLLYQQSKKELYNLMLDLLENDHYIIICSNKTVSVCALKRLCNKCPARFAYVHACTCDLLRTFKCSERNDLRGKGWAKTKSASSVLGLIYLGILKGYAGWLQHTCTHTHTDLLYVYARVCCCVINANCTTT